MSGLQTTKSLLPKKTFRCVKCTDPHETKECTQNIRDDKVKCVDYNGDNLANCRGCLVHKQLQQKLYPALKEKRNMQPQNQPKMIQQIQPGMIYEQVAISNQIKNNFNNKIIIETNQPINNKLEEMLSRSWCRWTLCSICLLKLSVN